MRIFRRMIGPGNAPRARAAFIATGVLLSMLPACAIPSRREGSTSPGPYSLGAAQSRPVEPAPAPVLPPAHAVAEPGPPANTCETRYGPPFATPMAWRTAYKGSGPGAYHHCPGWSSFGPVRPNRKWHKGVDIAAPTGMPVRSAVAGTLSYGRDPTGWGLYARVRFVPSRSGQTGTCESGEPMELIYAHLLEDLPPAALRGDRPVAAGEIVGHVGCSGNARGMCSPSPESHLHLTLRRSQGNREKVDPLPVVGWSLAEPPASTFAPPLLACPLAAGQTSASAR